MVYRKLDKVPGEMCAAADEDLWFRNMRGVRVWIFGLRKGDVCRMVGKSGKWCEEEKIRKRTSMTFSVMSLPLPKA